MNEVAGGIRALQHQLNHRLVPAMSEVPNTPINTLSTRALMNTADETLSRVVGKGTGNPVVDKYGILKKDKTIPGQAHHLNQDAAYREAIPTNEGLSTKLEGNAFKDVNSPHYNAHENLEQFWNQYRRGGTKYGEVPTNLEYTKAMVDSLKAAGYSQQQAMQIANKAIKQRIQYGLLGGEPVPRIPGKINQTKRQ